MLHSLRDEEILWYCHDKPRWPEGISQQLHFCGAFQYIMYTEVSNYKNNWKVISTFIVVKCLQSFTLKKNKNIFKSYFPSIIKNGSSKG